ncbi:unnamed protein product [Closterium sp. NIES-53]
MATLPRFDFGFAFREPSFSDCVLRLVIEPHSTGTRPLSAIKRVSKHVSLLTDLRHLFPCDALVISLPGLHDISPATGSASSAKDREENDSLAAAAAATKVSEPLQKSTRAAAAAAPATAGAADPPAAGASPPETSTADAASRASLPPADPVTRDVPAASVVLASKSTFFRALFTSGFSETLDRRLVHIHLTAQGMSEVWGCTCRCFASISLPFRAIDTGRASSVGGSGVQVDLLPRSLHQRVQ